MKIISGCQTGVDRAALDVAIELGIDWGGWAPKGWKDEESRIPEKYRVRMEESSDEGYGYRTMLNVTWSDATLLVIPHGIPLTPGTRKTSWLCTHHKKPSKVWNVTWTGPESINQLRRWIAPYEVLNVAGPRESKCPGIYEQAKALLLEALR